ncbi:MAG: hypothetical protein ACKOZU_12605 [Planctomycetaceae bacterium]
MHDVLKQRAADLARLAARMRTSLDEAESTIPGINEQLATLAEVGIGNLQFEGPVIGCPPTGAGLAVVATVSFDPVKPACAEFTHADAVGINLAPDQTAGENRSDWNIDTSR